MFQIASLASISTQVGFMAHPWSLSPVVKGQAGCSSSFLWGCIRCNPQDLSDHSSKTNISGRLCNPFLRKMLVMQQLAPATNEVESGVVKKVPQLKMENLSSPALWVWSLSLAFPSPTPHTQKTEIHVWMLRNRKGKIQLEAQYTLSFKWEMPLRGSGIWRFGPQLVALFVEA